MIVALLIVLLWITTVATATVARNAVRRRRRQVAYELLRNPIWRDGAPIPPDGHIVITRNAMTGTITEWIYLDSLGTYVCFYGHPDLERTPPGAPNDGGGDRGPYR